MSLISVIVPNYNHATFLPQRINSVLNQTFKDFELIILDDCSTDNSREIIESYRDNSRISHILYNEKNSGSTFKQWQKGIELAKGDFIWIAESDDWAEENFLQKIMSIIRTDQSIGLAYCQSYDVDEKGGILGSRLKWTDDFAENIWKKDFIMRGEDFMNFLYRKNVIPNTSACVVKKACLMEALKEIPDLQMAGDWFTWLIILDQPEVSVAFVSDHLNYFRETGQSTRNHSSKERQSNRLLEEAKIFNLGEFEIDISVLEDKNKLLLEKWLHLYASQKISLGFFRICNWTKISKGQLVRDYIKARKIAKRK